MKSNWFGSNTQKATQRPLRGIVLWLCYSGLCLSWGFITAIGSETHSRIQRFVEGIDSNAKPMTVARALQTICQPARKAE